MCNGGNVIRLKIGYLKYVIRFVKGLKHEDQDLFGHHLGDRELILINLDSGKRRISACILHEVLHALSDYAYINLKEKQITALANVLTTVIKDNPKEVDDFIDFVHGRKRKTNVQYLNK
jgi:hypothetical protein